MTEAMLQNGDYVPDGAGGFVRLTGDAALLARVLFKLTARRGRFPFLPELGSRLYLLPREPEGKRAAAAALYVAQALADEADLTVESVVCTPDADGGAAVEVRLRRGEDALAVSLTVE